MKKRALIFILSIYAILIIGIALTEAIDPNIFGHNLQNFNGFHWNGPVGKLTYNTTALPGGHSTSEIEDVVWFDNNKDGIKETGVILKNNALGYGYIIISIPSITYTIIGGAQISNSFTPNLQFFLRVDKDSTNIYYKQSNSSESSGVKSSANSKSSSSAVR